jgi:hypothetical protein
MCQNQNVIFHDKKGPGPSQFLNPIRRSLPAQHNHPIFEDVLQAQ